MSNNAHDGIYICQNGTFETPFYAIKTLFLNKNAWRRLFCYIEPVTSSKAYIGHHHDNTHNVHKHYTHGGNFKKNCTTYLEALNLKEVLGLRNTKMIAT